MSSRKSPKASKGKTIKPDLTSKVQPPVLEALGRVVVEWAFLEWAAQKLAEFLRGLIPRQAQMLMPRIRPPEMRTLIEAVGERELDKENASAVTELMKRFDTLADQRNRFMHDRWWQVFGTQDKAVRESTKVRKRAAPVARISLRASEIGSLADRMNTLSGDMVFFTATKKSTPYISPEGR